MTSPASSRSRPARARPRRSDSRAGATLRWIIGGSLLLVIGGFGLLAWTRTPTGRATLLRLGADRMYPAVQASIDAALLEALPAYPANLVSTAGVRSAAAADETAYAWPLPAAGPGARILCRLLPVDAELSYWEAQARVAAALRPTGGRVLWGERCPLPRRWQPSSQTAEERDLLRLDLGVDGRPTHTLLLYKASTKQPLVLWGGRRQDQRLSSLGGSADGPVVAVVIDDWGYFENDATRQLMAMEVPLTLAVLPGLPFSRRYALEATELAVMTARPDATQKQRRDLRRQRLACGCPVEFSFERSTPRLSARRREVILHLPMQPLDYPEIDPGPRAILVGMPESEINERITQALAALPGVTGVSSHMGSAATADRRTMQRVMKVLAREGLFFLDSLTSPQSVAAAEAERAGLPALRCRLFLDQVESDRQQVRRNLARLVKAARTSGYAVGIGHPYAETVAVLCEELPRWQKEGVRFVTLSELLAWRDLEPGEGRAAMAAGTNP